MATVSKSTILGEYLGTTDASVISQVSNILESFFHKAEGKVVKKVTEIDDKIAITFSDDSSKTFYNSEFVDTLLATINSNPIDGWVFVKTKAQMEALVGDNTKGYYILKDDVDDAYNGQWGYDGAIFYKGDEMLSQKVDKNNTIKAVSGKGIYEADKAVISNNYIENSIINGFSGTDNTYTRGATRINPEQYLEDTLIEELNVFGEAGSFKILELTRNDDLSFNLKDVVFDGLLRTGHNKHTVPHPSFLTKKISKGSYLAFYSSNSGAQGSYQTGGSGFSYAGEITGNGFVAPFSAINMNFSIIGKSLNNNFINKKIDELESGSVSVVGNQLTGTGATDINWVNIIGIPTLNDGYIKKFNLLSLDVGVIAILEYKKLDNGNFKFIRQLGEFDVIIGTNNIDCLDFVEKDIYFGFFSSDVRVVWANSGLGYRIAGYPAKEENEIPVTSANFAINFEMQYNSVDRLKSQVESLKSDKLDGVIFHLKETITPDFTNIGWSGKDSPTVVDSYIYFNKPNGFDQSVADFQIKPIDLNTKIVMVQSGRGIYVTFDLSNSQISIHEYWSGDVNVIPTVIVTGVIEIDLNLINSYILRVEKFNAEKIEASIINSETLDRFSLVHLNSMNQATNPPSINTTHGDSAGSFGLIYKSGSFIRNNFKQYTNQKTKPHVLVSGDSYVFGLNLLLSDPKKDESNNQLPPYELKDRWVNLLKNELNGDVTVSATGGEDTSGMLLKIDTDLKMIKPKWHILAIGLNDAIQSTATFSQWKVLISKAIRIVRNNGAIPILTTFPRLGSGASQLSQMNSWIRNYSGELYVDFQILSTTSGVIGAPPNNKYLTADGHPNKILNNLMFEKLKIDVPQLFEN
jgi:hypothetical protein